MSALEILQRSLDNFNILTENNTLAADIDILDQSIVNTVMELMSENPELGTKLDVLLDMYCPPATITFDDRSFQNGIHNWLVDSVKMVSVGQI